MPHCLNSRVTAHIWNLRVIRLQKPQVENGQAVAILVAFIRQSPAKAMAILVAFIRQSPT